MSYKKRVKISYHLIDSNSYGHNLLFGLNPGAVVSGELCCRNHCRCNYEHLLYLHNNLSWHRDLWEILPEISSVTLLKKWVCVILFTPVQNALINDIELLDNRLRNHGHGILW